MLTRNQLEKIRVTTKSLQGVVKQAKKLLVINSDNNCEFANNFVLDYTAIRNQVERDKLAATKELRDKVKAFNNGVAEKTKEADEAVKAVKQAVIAYHNEREQEKRQEEIKSIKEVGRREAISKGLGGDGVAKTPVPVVKKLVTELNIKTTKRWGAEVVDKEAVPEKYKDVNTTRIMTAFHAAKKDKKTLEVPGIKFVQVKGLSR